MHQSLAADAPFIENSLSEQKTSASIPHEHSANSAVQHQKSWHRTIATQTAMYNEARLVEEHVTMTEAPADQPFSVLGLNHIAIAVPDLEAAAEMYRTVFGASVSHPKPEPAHGVTVVFVKLPGVTIELLHPLGEASPIGKFLQKSPKGGLHHVCLTVDNIHRASEHLGNEGVHMLGDGKPKIGAHGEPVVFVNPKDTNGVLIELEEASGEIHPCDTKEKW